MSVSHELLVDLKHPLSALSVAVVGFAWPRSMPLISAWSMPESSASRFA